MNFSYKRQEYIAISDIQTGKSSLYTIEKQGIENDVDGGINFSILNSVDQLSGSINQAIEAINLIEIFNNTDSRKSVELMTIASKLEVDLMALNGITTPLTMVGTEVVWRNTLRKFNYSDAEIKEFLSGPAYLSWFLMGNLTQLGGPLPDEWFDKQAALQSEILTLMREFGMNPVLQGFYRMVPASLKDKFPEAKIISQGKWAGGKLDRPPVLAPSDPLFVKMAKVWYEEQQKLFGKADYFGGDLFHEGGNTGGLNVTVEASKVQEMMLNANPDAVWVIQSWGSNPLNELLDGLKKENTLIVDLCAEYWDRWRTRRGFNGFPGYGPISQTGEAISVCTGDWTPLPRVS